MRKKIVFAGIVSVASLAAVIGANCTDKEAANVALCDVEAIAICEVSADASKNTGYCSTLLGTSIETCSTTGDPASVRCSGTILLSVE